MKGRLSIRLKDQLPRRFAAGVLVFALAAGAFAVQAQQLPPYQGASKVKVEARPEWSALSPSQREALKPLEREWATIDADRKQKWLAIAAKFPTMSAQERTRIQARMSDWTKLSPQERGVARQHFQTAKRAAPQDRTSQWAAYQALTADEKRTLAALSHAPPAARIAVRPRFPPRRHLPARRKRTSCPTRPTRCSRGQ
jgi:Protein of unknown function (DUF3106)